MAKPKRPKYQPKVLPAKRECILCHRTYQPRRTDQQYCSPICRQRAKAGRAKDTPPLKVPGIPQIKRPAPPKVKFPAPPKYDEAAAFAKFSEQGVDPVAWLSTGIPVLDGLTKIPLGRVTQIQGPYGVGKTTLCLNMIAGMSHTRTLYIDTEAALNPQMLVDLKIQPKFFTIWNQSAFIEDIYDEIIRAVRSQAYDLIIFDSLAACTFRTEAAGAAADANIGQKARVVNKLMRIIPMDLKAAHTALVIINQEREVIGAYHPTKYTPGGMGVPYAASLIMALKTTLSARFPKGGPYEGQMVTAKIIKSKVNQPFRELAFPLYYGGVRAKAQNPPALSDHPAAGPA